MSPDLARTTPEGNPSAPIALVPSPQDSLCDSELVATTLGRFLFLVSKALQQSPWGPDASPHAHRSMVSFHLGCLFGGRPCWLLCLVVETQVLSPGGRKPGWPTSQQPPFQQALGCQPLLPCVQLSLPFLGPPGCPLPTLPAGTRAYGCIAGPLTAPLAVWCWPFPSFTAPGSRVQGPGLGADEPAALASGSCPNGFPGSAPNWGERRIAFAVSSEGI